jgi:hypothetical protein
MPKAWLQVVTIDPRLHVGEKVMRWGGISTITSANDNGVEYTDENNEKCHSPLLAGFLQPKWVIVETSEAIDVERSQFQFLLERKDLHGTKHNIIINSKNQGWLDLKRL